MASLDLQFQEGTMRLLLVGISGGSPSTTVFIDKHVTHLPYIWPGLSLLEILSLFFVSYDIMQYNHSSHQGQFVKIKFKISAIRKLLVYFLSFNFNFSEFPHIVMVETGILHLFDKLTNQLRNNFHRLNCCYHPPSRETDIHKRDFRNQMIVPKYLEVWYGI